ncbi:hypothetical protein KUTeg_017725 [Tegillarca granosa]|uniref:Calx-beta domain-containing protein n=1 Tax=Tegillarca granosa TaxID=220873 RepID=A0ABQ9EJM9_TEGGR|nr:hypothetical protein KUTeg_017725 [Tegillarca granosa]
MFFQFVAVLCFLVSPTFSQVTVQFVDTAVLVDEGQQFSLRVKKSGTVTNTIHFVVEVIEGTINVLSFSTFSALIIVFFLQVDRNDDFIGNSQVGSFYPGGPEVSSVTFTVLDDTLPEVEETFTFSLDVKTSGVIKGSENIAIVTIRANDDAYGVFGFVDVNSSNPDAVPGVDISPANGTIQFQTGETINYLQLQIRSDNIPENNEEFTITLTGAEKGARVESTEVLLIIQANDAPIRFQLSEYRFDEGPGDKTVYIQVLRGIDVDGETRIGSVSSVATVDYVVVPDTATSGIDFRAQSNQVVFDTSGQTHQVIPIIIVDDSSPEVEERFQIILSEPKVPVTINVANGEIGFHSTVSVLTSEPESIPYQVQLKLTREGTSGRASITWSLSGSVTSTDVGQSSGTVFMEEDESKGGITNYLSILVMREMGRFGTVTVLWGVTPSTGNDLVPVSGSITFGEGQDQGFIRVETVADDIPEPPETFVIELTQPGGGAQLNMSANRATVVINQNDNPLYFKGDVVLTQRPNVSVTILANDEAYGVFLFNAPYEREVEEGSVATYEIGRNKGRHGEVEVFWEIQDPSTNQPLQEGGDFLIVNGSVVFKETEFYKYISVTPRADSAPEEDKLFNIVLKEVSDQFVTVPQINHPPENDIQDGFTLSAWVQPFSSSVNGYIVAKTTNDGSRYLYTLKLITGPSGAIILFGFSQTGSTNNQQISVSYNSILHDRKWHHILVIVATGTITFYVDGLVIGTRYKMFQKYLQLFLL